MRCVAVGFLFVQPRALRIVGALIGLLGGVLTAAWYSQLATYDSVSDSGWTRSFVAGTVGLVVSVIGFTMLIFARPRGVVGVRAQ